jgi:ADP-ribosylglycohydrolase
MSLLSKIQGSFLGVIIGDAMGMPWEIFNAEKIAELTEGAGVTGFTSPVFRRLAETEHLKLGSPTDDWQGSLAVGKSLIRRRGFDLFDQTLAQIAAYETNPAGWGGTTRRGLEQLRDYFTSRGAEGRHPSVWPTGTGCGNGIAMKISPLAHFCALKLRTYQSRLAPMTAKISFTSLDLREWTVALGGLTHPDFRATVAGYALGSMLSDLLMFEPFEGPANPDSDRRASRWVLERTIELSQELEKTRPSSETDQFSARLRRLQDEKLLFGPIETLRDLVGTDCLALESVVFAIAVFLRHPRNFREGVLEAVNSGGDTDTIAAMAGSLIGTVVGVEGVPEEWRQFTPEFATALTLGEELFQAARQG